MVTLIPGRRVASFGLDGRCAVAPCRLDVSTDLWSHFHRGSAPL